MDGWKKGYKINGWLDGYTLIYEIIYGWLDGYKNQINGRIQRKKLMVGGWWIEKKGWLGGQKRQMDGWMYCKKQMDGWKEGYKINGWLDGYKLIL